MRFLLLILVLLIIVVPIDKTQAQDFYIMDTLSVPPLYIETRRIILDLNTCDLSTTTSDFNLSTLPFRPIDMTATGEIGINIPVSMWIDYDESVNSFPEDVIAYSYWVPFATSGVGPAFAPENAPKGLATDYDFESYLVGDYLSHINDVDDIVTPLGLLPINQRPKGQMTYREGSFYYPSVSDELIQLKVAGSSYWIRSLGNLPDSLNYGGIFSIPHTCDSTATYLIHHDPDVGSTLYHLDVPIVSLTEHCTIPYKPSAAAHVGENTLPPCDPLQLDLSLQNATTLNQYDSICSGTIFPLDEHLQLSPNLEFDSLVVTLQNPLDNPNELINISASHPEVLLNVLSTTQITLASTGFTKAGPLLEVLASLSYTNDAANPTLGQRIVEVTAYHPHYGTTSSSILIEVTNDGTEMVIPMLTEPSCFGESDGLIDLNLASSDSFHVVWENGSEDLPYVGLSSGSYNYEITDNAGCIYTDELVLEEPDTLILSITAAQDSICGANGVLTAMPQGGTPEYTYEWSNGEMGETIGGLTDGTYDLIVTDVNVCPAIAEYILYESESISEALSETACLGAAFTINGQTYAQDTTFQQTLTSSDGCDSLLNVQLTFLDTFYSVSAYELCPGESIDIGSQLITQDTSFSIILQTQEGCDSTEHYAVSFSTPIVTPISAEICEGEDYDFAGVQLSATGIYYDTLVASSGCDSLLELNLQVNELPDIQIEQQGNLCAGEEVILDIGSGYANISWSTGSAQNSILVNSTGTYSLIATGVNGCTNSASISITDEPPIVDFVASGPACPGGTGQLELIVVGGGLPPYQIEETGQVVMSGDVVTDLPIGNYSYSLQDNSGCSTSLSFEIAPDNDLFVDLPEELVIKLGESITIPTLTSFSPAFISWTPPEDLDCTDCLTPLASPNETTRYFLDLVDANDCNWEGSLLVRVEQPSLYLPNVFSPNGDGNNDLFRPGLNSGVSGILYFSVYDRWGAQVFNSSGGMKAWDGQVEGRLAPQGVYVYFIQWQDQAGKIQLETGEVTLLR
ncbi:MAG: gliding motility-associated C-terminal domain-containing protein [Bacteroidota bacterium]